MRGDVVGGQSIERLRVELHDAPVTLDVARELLSDEHQLFVESPDAFAGGLVAIDTGAPEVAQRALHVVTGRLVLAAQVERPERLVDAAIERQLGGELCDVLRPLLGDGANGGIGVDPLEEPGQAADRVELDGDGVVRHERVLDRSGARAAVHRFEMVPGGLQVLGGERGELRRSRRDARSG